MKNTLGLILLSTVLLNGCVVSKKKYDASLLENLYLNKKLSITLDKNKTLKNELKSNISEFETMKNELHLSNAVKSDEMSDLLVKVTQLTDLNTKLKSDLDESLKQYKSQKQTSVSITDKLKNLKRDNQNLKRDTASILYALKLSKERFGRLEKELELQKDKYHNVNSKNQKTTQELEVNKQKLVSFEKQLVRNQEKIEAISTALIELRKEMLSAKTANKALDPNKNKHIDKMAKELGHY